MRKYLLNGAVISAVFGAIGVANASKNGPRNWPLILKWVSWGLGVAIAVGSVMAENRELDESELDE